MIVLLGKYDFHSINYHPWHLWRTLLGKEGCNNLRQGFCTDSGDLPFHFQSILHQEEECRATRRKDHLINEQPMISSTTFQPSGQAPGGLGEKEIVALKPVEFVHDPKIFLASTSEPPKTKTHFEWTGISLETSPIRQSGWLPSQESSSRKAAFWFIH